MQNVPYTSESINGRKFKWWHVLIAGVVLFFGGIAFLIFTVFAATGPAVDATEEFFNALTTGEDTQAVYEDTASVFQEAMTYQDFVLALEANPIMTHFSSVSFDSKEINTDEIGTFAVLIGTIYGQDDTYSPITIQVVNEESEWKVAYINLNPIDDTN